VPCNFLAQHRSGRRMNRPYGSFTPCARTGNRHLGRSVFLSALSALIGCDFTIEQPKGSLLPQVPRYAVNDSSTKQVVIASWCKVSKVDRLEDGLCHECRDPCRAFHKFVVADLVVQAIVCVWLSV
jgi:hypothetical protein